MLVDIANRSNRADLRQSTENIEGAHGPFPAEPVPKAAPERPQRDEWMMMPPKQDDLASRMDPAKQRARGFNTGKGAKGPSTKDDDNSAWYETPEQKQKRLQEELMGTAKPSASPAPERAGKAAKAAKDEAEARKIREQIVSLAYCSAEEPNVDCCYRRSRVDRRSWNSTRRIKAQKSKTTRANAPLIVRKIWRVGKESAVRRRAKCSRRLEGFRPNFPAGAISSTVEFHSARKKSHLRVLNRRFPRHEQVCESM